MNKAQLKSQIQVFWQWFVTHEKKFRIIEDPHAVREMLNNQVLLFGALSWEIGKGAVHPHRFTISPNGNEKMLWITEAIIGEAPRLDQWDFHPAKPAIDWDFIIEVYDDFLRKQTVNTSEWSYLLRMTPDKKLRLLLYAEDFNFVDEEDKMMAANLVVNNCIGEANKIYFVESIVFMDHLTDYELEALRLLPNLKAEFEELIED